MSGSPAVVHHREPDTGSNGTTGRLRAAITLIALSLTFGLVQLDATIINVALQTLRTDLGGGIDAAQWVVDGYAVPFAACMLTAGALGDRFGHRRSCLAGFVIFGVASAAAALSGDWIMLITARVVQGVGAAIMLPASLALVSRLYPDERRRARALGVWGGVATAGFAAGPVVGGLLIRYSGWPAIFWINLPVAAVVGGAIALLAPADQPRHRRFDPAGTALIVIALAGITGGIIEAGSRQLLPAIGLLIIGAGTAVLVVRLERRSEHPLVPADLVGSSIFRWALITGFAFNFGMYGALLCVSLTLQGGYGMSPLAGGLAVLPMAVVVSIGATFSGFLAAVVGPRRPMIAGFVLAGCGALLISIGAFGRSELLIIIGMAGIGLCSLAMPAMTGVTLNAAAPEHSGLAGGSLNTSRQMGGALGVATLGAVLGAGGFRLGLGTALLITALVCAAGVLSSVKATADGSAGRREGRN
jgi:MFS transporter, DHA2 family, methylenomycin A resistance protein